MEEMGKKENKQLREDMRRGKEKKVPFQEQKEWEREKLILKVARWKVFIFKKVD